MAREQILIPGAAAKIARWRSEKSPRRDLSSGNSCAGFTLIELLVVIATILVLAALLVPALHQALASTRRAQCISNLRQFGFATRMYWDANDDACFRYRGMSTNNGDIFWFGWLERGFEGQRAFDATQGALYPYLRGRGVEICPSLNYSLAKFKLDRRQHRLGARLLGVRLRASARALPTADRRRLDPDLPLYAYREATLALIVRTIDEGAQLEINTHPGSAARVHSLAHSEI